MAIYSKKEFADYCGEQTKDLSNYIKRGTVVCDKDGNINSNEPKNNSFVQKRLSRLKEKANNNEVNIPKTIQNTVITTVTAKTNKTEKLEGVSKTFAELEREKLIADIAKKEADLEKALLTNAKIKGEVIPFGLMKPLIAQNNQSITTEFKNAAEELISNISKKKSLSSSEVAELNKTLVTVINEAIKKATDLSIKNINLIINDYQSSIK
jgi:hypothetical protein